jgi:hypothetical protein
MKHTTIALLLAFSLFTSGCTAALLVGAGGAAGYLFKENQDLKEEK